MEPSRGASQSPSIAAGHLLLFILGTVICSRATVDAYTIATPSLPWTSNTPTRIISNGRPRSMRLYSSSSDTDDANDESSSGTSAIAKATASAPPGVQFGDVAPMQRKSSSASSAEFGDVVSISRPASSTPSMFGEETPKTTTSKPSSGLSDVEMLKQRKTRNIAVAILSVCLAMGNYAYQWTHPVTPIQLLVNMERSSAPLSDIGKNSKPTVIDFWAPWCENCRYMAPTMFQIEETYKDKVNFVMVNADDPDNWPLIVALGVDAIPHMALLESDGTADTALIGAVPKEWLSDNLDVLVDNASKGAEQTTKRPLPHQMLDVFANRPESRKITNLAAVVEAGKR